MGKTSSLNWYIYRMCSFDCLNKHVQERRENVKLSKAERKKLVDEIARKMKKLDTGKHSTLPEETRKYIEEAEEKYLVLFQRHTQRLPR